MGRGFWEGTNATTQTLVTIIPGSSLKQFVTHAHSTLAHLFIFCHDFKGNKWSENVE